MLARPEPVDLTVWSQTDGSVIEYKNCIGLKYDAQAGNRTVKLLTSNLVRTVRDVCIYKINDLEVYL